VEYQGKRIIRKIQKLDGMRIQMQSFENEFEAAAEPAPQVRIMGRCVKLQRTL